MKLHHIGYLIKKIETAQRAFEALGYEPISLWGGDPVCYDTTRKCDICFLKPPTDSELLSN